MKQQEAATQAPLIYVTANSLMSKDVSLESALQVAKDAGADGFELRSELLPSGMQPFEVENLRLQLKRFPSPPAYSVPRPLFEEGRLQRDFLLQVLAEARSFGCHFVKFSPFGQVPSESEFDALSTLLYALQQEAPYMKVMVENDQTAGSGHLAQWVRFFEQAAVFKCPIWMTFDLGNWDCVGVDTTEAAQALGNAVAYVHVKSVEFKDNQWVSRPIHFSSAPHPALIYLAPDAPRAIEFPVAAAGRDTLITKLHTYITWLRSGSFVT
jgi:sugar phosphate isomerase/epimerase